MKGRAEALRRESSNCIASHNQLLVRRQNGRRHGSIWWGDQPVALAGLVPFGADADTQELHIFQRVEANGGRVFADAASEDDGVQTAHGGGIGADRLADLVGERIQRELRRGVARLGGLLQIADVAAGDAGDSSQSSAGEQLAPRLGRRPTAPFHQE